MALGYDRLVSYGRPFNQNHFLRDPVSIKREPGLFDYVRKDHEMYSLEEPRLYLGKEKSVLGDCELTSWTNKHPKHWTKKEVLDWIFSVVESDNLDGSRVQGEAYRDFTGEKLYTMSKEDFENVDPNYGVKMYETFRNLVKNISFEKPSQVNDLQGLDDFNHLNSEYYHRLNKDILERVSSSSSHAGRHENNNSSCSYSATRCSSASVDSLKIIKTDNDVTVDIPSLGVYSISQDIEFPLSSPMFQSSAARLDSSCHFLTPLHPAPGQFTSYQPSPFSTSPSPSCSVSAMSSDQHPVKYANGWHPNIPIPVSVHSSPDRPSSSLASSPRRLDDTDSGCASDDSATGPWNAAQADGFYVEDDVMMPECSRNKSYPDVGGSYSGQQPNGDKQKNGKKGRNNATKNGNHLWEFVRDLLRDPATNPKLLKWEDKEHGVFRFLQSEAVAQLWGEKKNNPQMTYEKLSRAMRFCRSAGYFESVPKNGKFPKKLCFMFGGRAHGWRD